MVAEVAMAREINLHIRIMRVHGQRVRRNHTAFTCMPESTRVADLQAWIAQEESSEEVELLHQGTTMTPQEYLSEYDIVAIPLIDAIATFTEQRKQICLEPKVGMTEGIWLQGKVFLKRFSPKAEASIGVQYIKGTKKAKVQLLSQRAKLTSQEHQTCSSTSIHIFALIACDEIAVKARFDLEIHSSAMCATVADIMKSVRTWMDEDSAAVEVMLVSDRSTPLDDTYSFEHNGLQAELYVVMSF